MKRRSFLLSSLGLTAAFAAGTHVRASTSSTDIIRVEEDWYIKVGDPDPAIDAPQIVTVFGPVDPITGTHAIFELNHGTQPDYAQGGMQLRPEGQVRADHHQFFRADGPGFVVARRTQLNFLISLFRRFTRPAFVRLCKTAYTRPLETFPFEALTISIPVISRPSVCITSSTRML